MSCSKIIIILSVILLTACSYDEHNAENQCYRSETFYSHKNSILIGVINSEPLSAEFCYLQMSVKSYQKSNLKELKKYLRKELDFSSQIHKSENKYTLTFSTKAFRNSIEGILLSASDMIYLSYAFDALPTEVNIFPSANGMKIKYSGKDLYTRAWLKALEENYFYAYHYLVEYIKNNPDDAKGYSMKGVIFSNVDLEMLTKDYLKKALEIDDSDSNGLRRMAFFLAQKGDYSAIAIINRYISEYPTNPLGIYYRGLIKLELGDTIGGCKDLENFDIVDSEYEGDFKRYCQ